MAASVSAPAHRELAVASARAPGAGCRRLCPRTGSWPSPLPAGWRVGSRVSPQLQGTLASTVTPFCDTEPSCGLHCHVESVASGEAEVTSAFVLVGEAPPSRQQPSLTTAHKAAATPMRTRVRKLEAYVFTWMHKTSENPVGTLQVRVHDLRSGPGFLPDQDSTRKHIARPQARASVSGDRRARSRPAASQEASGVPGVRLEPSK
eukprot:scaffold144612_cov99-Phaeocystis_antarctica.AAC.2